jgi:hypothetical protein
LSSAPSIAARRSGSANRPSSVLNTIVESAPANAGL